MYLVKHLSRNTIFMTKSVSKTEAVEQNQQPAIINERKTLAFMQILGINSPFVPSILATPTDETILHLLSRTATYILYPESEQGELCVRDIGGHRLEVIVHFPAVIPVSLIFSCCTAVTIQGGYTIQYWHKAGTGTA